MDHGPAGLRVFERVGEGDYRLRSEWKVNYADQTTTIWSDANGDLKADNGETTLFIPELVAVGIINLDARTGGRTLDVRTCYIQNLYFRFKCVSTPAGICNNEGNCE